MIYIVNTFEGTVYLTGAARDRSDRFAYFGGKPRVPTILAELLSDLGQVTASNDADGDFLREE